MVRMLGPRSHLLPDVAMGPQHVGAPHNGVHDVVLRGEEKQGTFRFNEREAIKYNMLQERGRGTTCHTWSSESVRSSPGPLPRGLLGHLSGCKTLKVQNIEGVIKARMACTHVICDSWTIADGRLPYFTQELIT